MKEIFTPNMRLSDMLDMNYSLVQVISRVGVDLKHSGLKVADACAFAGIDPATFILISNVYSFPEYTPSPEEVASADIHDIIRYLHGSHDYYTGMALKNLESSFDRLVKPCDNNQKKVILKFFVDYKKELEKHFSREEEEVFPYVESLLSGVRDPGYSITDFEEHHENVDEKMEDMKNIVMKYLPDVCDEDMKMWVLLSIYRLRDDLRRHTYVEDNILVPTVKNLERDGR